MARSKPKVDQPSEDQPEMQQVAAKKTTVVTIRGTFEWKAWLDRFAANRRASTATIMDQALTAAAAEAGFEPPPPRT